MTEAPGDNPRPPEVSVVVPSYGCESCLPALVERLVAVLEPHVASFELVLVDDRSTQADWSVIVRLAADDPRVVGIRLARNFGQHAAILAGLSHASGRFVVVMDCDLQDPPEAIPGLLAKAREGFPTVFARRVNRKDERKKRWLGRAFWSVYAWLGGSDPDPTVGNFSVISRKVVRELLKFRDRTRNYGIEVHWLGFPVAYVDVEHSARHSGRSTYTFGRQARHAISTVLSQSTRPLYASAALGLAMAVGAAGTTLYLILRKLITGFGIEGWTSVMVSLFFLFGVLFLVLGVMGLYLGNVFLESKQRPVFVVDETTAGEEP